MNVAHHNTVMSTLFQAQQDSGIAAGDIVFDASYRCFGIVELYDVWTVILPDIRDVIPVFLPKRHLRLKSFLHNWHRYTKRII